MSEVERLTEECAGLLESALPLIARTPAPVFRTPVPGCEGGVGAQLRHCLDCFQCLLEGNGEGRVDYDRRARNLHAEVDPERAAARIEETVRQLRAFAASAADRELAVRMDEPSCRETEGWLRSTTARELRFLASHTVHHYAILSLLLQAHGIALDPDFGLAPATAHFRRRSGRAAQEG